MKLAYKSTDYSTQTDEGGTATSTPYSNTKVALGRFYAGMTQITARRGAKKCRKRPRGADCWPLGLSALGRANYELGRANFPSPKVRMLGLGGFSAAILIYSIILQ